MDVSLCLCDRTSWWYKLTQFIFCRAENASNPYNLTVLYWPVLWNGYFFLYTPKRTLCVGELLSHIHNICRFINFLTANTLGQAVVDHPVLWTLLQCSKTYSAALYYIMHNISWDPTSYCHNGLKCLAVIAVALPFFCTLESQSLTFIKHLHISHVFSTKFYITCFHSGGVLFRLQKIPCLINMTMNNVVNDVERNWLPALSNKSHFNVSTRKARDGSRLIIPSHVLVDEHKGPVHSQQP